MRHLITSTYGCGHMTPGSDKLRPMGVIGQLIGEAIGGLAEFTRDSIAKHLRKMADEVEAGDLIPDEALAKAKATQGRIDDIRSRLPPG